MKWVSVLKKQYWGLRIDSIKSPGLKNTRFVLVFLSMSERISPFDFETLNNKKTLSTFGKVVRGLEVVDEIRQGNKIISIKIVE